MMNDRIYTEYAEKVRRYILGKVHNPHDAEELVSSVFMKAYQRAETFDEERASASTWIYTIAHNTVIDFYRKRRSHAELTETMSYYEPGFEEVLKKETLDELARALEKLDQRQRDLIILHYYSGCTLKEIAAKMGMSYPNAKVIHAKALRRLKDFLEEK